MNNKMLFPPLEHILPESSPANRPESLSPEVVITPSQSHLEAVSEWAPKCVPACVGRGLRDQ